tara:strand:- start:11417 stop:12391 length:975 start_codon:yes stop_codon:yes gene_type:complete
LQNAGRNQGKTTGGLKISAPYQQQTTYRGRFAPSPTGPLHAGSLIAALASYLDARANRGLWFLRIEDLDPPRESPAALKQILQALEELNLLWDGEIIYQSQRSQAYQEALARLQEQALIFPCTCSRQDIQDHGGIYPGFCRERELNEVNAESDTFSLRCKVPDIAIQFDDLLQGKQSQNLRSDVGDFILKRKDGLFAYQLAVVVDDAFQEITHVVRGIDLIDSTPRQIYLQRLLGYKQPVYAHIPVIINSQGQKLSKQHHANPLPAGKPSLSLYQALICLHQQPDADLKNAAPADIITWAIEHWNIDRLSELKHLDEDQFYITY